MSKVQRAMDWKWVKLGEVCDFIGGGTPSKKEDKYWGGNINWASVKDVKGDFLTATKDKITALGQEKSAKNIAEVGDLILITRISPGKTIISKVRSAINQDLKIVKPKFPTTSQFLAYYFQAFERELIKKSSGTTVLGITLNVLKEIPIPLLDLPTQAAIVSKIEELFSELDKGVENLRTAQQQLRTYRQSVLKWAFEGKLTNQDPVPQEGIGPAPDGSNPLPIRELPEGWKLVPIKEVAECLDNKRKPVNKTERLKRVGSIPYYGANGRTGWIDDYLFDEPLVLVVEDETFVGRILPFSYKIVGKSWVNNHAHILKAKPTLNLDFLNYQLSYYPFLALTTGTTGRKKLTKDKLVNAPIKVCSLKEQNMVVAEIERRLTVTYNLEENIGISLLQAESLRQSILKMAFEGRLVLDASTPIEKPKPKLISSPPPQEAKPKSKPKNDHWYKVQIMGYILHYSKTKGIEHGEMTLAKYTYLIDKIYGVKTGYEFERGHLGPYSIEMKKIVNDKKFFDHVDNHLELKNPDTIFKYSNSEETKVQKGIKALCDIFGTYPANRKAHKIELLATVCKVLEDIKSTDLAKVRKSMKEWKINLTTTHFKNKAEKFTEAETKKCVAFIVKQGWDKKLQ